MSRNHAGTKRILQEVKEMQRLADAELAAGALEDNIFEWQFVVRGPRDTEFQGGIYHGRIQLPPEYPFKPPAFQLCTPNGRFEVGTKVCLSMSQHHPEHWQPSWSIRTALTALIAFLPTPGKGALGSLDYPAEDRRVLAAKSRGGPPTFGCPQRQKLAAELHAKLLAAEQRVAEAPARPEGPSQPAAAGSAADCAAPSPSQAVPSEATPSAQPPAPAALQGGGAASMAPLATPLAPGPAPPAAKLVAPPSAPLTLPLEPGAASQVPHVQPLGPAPPGAGPSGGGGFARQGSTAGIVEELTQPVTLVQSWEEAGLTGLAALLIVGIGGILLRRILVVAGFDITSSLY